jgi:hypothetical protein
MGLEQLKKEIAEKESIQKSILISEEKKRQELIQNEERKVNLSLVKDLPKLKLIENDFWKMANKFSDIIKLGIHSYKKRKTFLGIFVLSSIKTKNYLGKKQYPKLEVRFDAGDDIYYGFSLEAKQGILFFKARHSYYSSTRIYTSSKLYSEHESQLGLENFDKTATIKWLEDQIVIFYKKK